MTKSESKIENEIKTFLVSLGAFVSKGNTKLNVGIPDIIACLNGRFLAIEVKKPSQKPRLSQKLKIVQIKKSGGIAFVAHSVTEVKDRLILEGLINE